MNPPPVLPPRVDPGGEDPPAWRRVRAVTLALLGVWAAVTFGTSFFARDLDATFFGWPLNWWIASQGALVVYVVLIGIYAAVASRLEDTPDGEPGAR